MPIETLAGVFELGMREARNPITLLLMASAATLIILIIWLLIKYKILLKIGIFVSSMINSILLAIVYIVGVGLVRLIARQRLDIRFKEHSYWIPYDRDNNYLKQF